MKIQQSKNVSKKLIKKDLIGATFSIDSIDVEVTEENLKSKSMNTLLNENEDMEGWKFSMSSYRTFKQIINIPLYDVDEWILMYKEKMLEI